MQSVNRHEPAEHEQESDADDAVVNKGKSRAAEMIERATSTFGNVGGVDHHWTSDHMLIVITDDQTASGSGNRGAEKASEGAV